MSRSNVYRHPPPPTPDRHRDHTLRRAPAGPARPARPRAHSRARPRSRVRPLPHLLLLAVVALLVLVAACAAPRAGAGVRANAARSGAVYHARHASVDTVTSSGAQAASVDTAAPTDPSGPCALPLTGARMSEGVTPWDDTYVRPLGTVRAAMIFVRFPDHTPTVTPARLARQYLPGLTRFYADASYGRARLEVRPRTAYAEVPRSAADYGVRRGAPYTATAAFVHDAVAAARAADPGLDLDGDQALYLVADPDAPGADHDATAATTLTDRDAVDTGGGTPIRQVALVWEGDTPDPGVLDHETGHLFGLPDLYLDPAPAGASGDPDPTALVGDWDVMADQSATAPEPLAWNKWKLGWLAPGQVDCVTGPGTTRHTLTPTEVPGGTKLVVVRRSATEAYAVEARGRYGNDRAMCSPGVLLYHVRTDVDALRGPVDVRDAHPATPGCARSREPAMADATLRPGDTYSTSTDDGTSRIAVTVNGQETDGSYQVSVTVARGRS